MITLPEEWEYFYNEMVNRAKKFITIDYWDITEDELLLWLQNFSTDEEQFLSALIIYRLTYRNESAILSMYRYIIEMLLPDALEKNGIYSISSLESFQNELEHSPWTLPFRFGTIDNVDTNPSKSGPNLLRLCQRKAPFHKKMQASTSTFIELSDSIKAIVLLDDFVGTGEQFDLYMQKLGDVRSKFLFIYCPLAAHEDGIKLINQKYPDCILLPVEVFTNKHSFFNKSSLPQIAESINTQDLLSLYNNLMTTKTKRKDNLLGRGDQALLHLFGISSPNNSLPILTHNETDWHRLFSR